MIVNSTPNSGNASNVRNVNTTGQLDNNGADGTNGGVLDC
jgi:hypothetical protein